MEKINFLNKRCLVIGGSSGIGLEFVKYLYLQNAKIIIASSFATTNEAIIYELFKDNKNIYIYKVDITLDDKIENLFDFVYKTFGKLDILINTFGLGFYKQFLNTSLQEIEKIIAINLTASIKVIRIFLPIINTSKQSYIIQIGSYAGKEVGHKLFSVYSASKAGLLGFFNSITFEYSKSNISFYLVYPPATKTSFFSKSIGGSDFEMKSKQDKLVSPCQIVDETFLYINQHKIQTNFAIYL